MTLFASHLKYVTGRQAEVPPSGLPHPDLARTRVRVGGGKNLGPDDRHAVA